MSEERRPRPDLVGVTLAVAFIAGLVGVSLWIISPFAGAIVWAALIVVSTWPGMVWLQKRLWNQRWLAVTAITLLMLLVLFVPLSLAIVGVVRNLDDFVDWVSNIQTVHLPPPPDWVAGLPFIGERAADAWNKIAVEGIAELVKQAKPYTSAVFTWLASRAGGVGWIMLQFLLIVAIAAVMYAYGESAAAGLRRFGRRLAGSRGEEMVILAGRAVRGVALGIVVTAFVQSVLGGLALGIAGVPFTLVLTGVMFMFCIAQLGPVLVLLPAVGWLWWQEHYYAMGFLLVCTIIVGTLDNILRPVLIRKGADLPLLLIFAGVIGGLVTFGLIGIFVGPVVLAITYTLLESWVLDATETPSP